MQNIQSYISRLEDRKNNLEREIQEAESYLNKLVKMINEKKDRLQEQKRINLEAREVMQRNLMAGYIK